MKSQKRTTTSQKLDYLIGKVEKVDKDVTDLKKDMKVVKKEVQSHTQLLQDITANADVYDTISCIHFTGMQYRRHIGANG